MQPQQIGKPHPLNFDNYTFRCSSLGKLMGEGKIKSSKAKIESKEAEIQVVAKMALVLEEKKSGKDYLNQVEKLDKLNFEPKELKRIQLPDTCTSYLIELYVQEKYNIKKDIYSKYLEKGLAKEDEAIYFLSIHHGKMYEKCTLPRQRNEYIEGECDILNDGVVIDIKNSWDLFTFYKRFNDEMLKLYKWQGVGYLELYNAQEFILAFCLMNMPEGLVIDERKRILFALGSDMENSPEFDNACREFMKKCQFDNLELAERIYDKLRITRVREEYEQVVSRVKECRKWLNEFSISEFRRCYGEEAYQDWLNSRGIENADIPTPEVARMVSLEVVEPEGIPIEDISESAPEEAIVIDRQFAEVYETEQAAESDVEVDEEIITTSIKNCKYQQELQKLYDENEEIVSQSEYLQNEFSNKEKELAFRENELKTHGIIEEPQNTLSIISACKSEDECIKLWNTPEVKKLFDTFPELKEALLNKRMSFKEVETATESTKPEAKPKPEKTPKPEKPEKQEKPKVEPKAKDGFKEITIDGIPYTIPYPSADTKKIEELTEKFNSFRTKEQITNFYRSPEVFNFINEPPYWEFGTDKVFVDPKNPDYKKIINTRSIELKNFKKEFVEPLSKKFQ